MSASDRRWRTRDDGVELTYLSVLENPVNTATAGQVREMDRSPCRSGVLALGKMLIVFSTPAAGAVMSTNLMVYAGVELLPCCAGLPSCCRFSTRTTCPMNEKMDPVTLSNVEHISGSANRGTGGLDGQEASGMLVRR